MNHVYNVCTCLGNHLASVEIALPDGCDDPTSWEACNAAVEAAGYNPWTVCDGCYDRAVRAAWAGSAEEFFPADGYEFEVYRPCTCVGDFVARVKITLPAGCNGPDDFRAYT